MIFAILEILSELHGGDSHELGGIGSSFDTFEHEDEYSDAHLGGGKASS